MRPIGPDSDGWVSGVDGGAERSPRSDSTLNMIVGWR